VIDAVVAAWAADTPAGIVDRGVGSVAEPFQGVPVLDQDGGWWVAVPTAALPGADAALLTDAEGGPAYAGTELGSPAQLAAAAAFEAEGLTLVQGRGWTAGTGLGLSCVALPSGAACAPLAESAPLLDAARPVLASVPAPASAPDPSTGLGTPVYGQPMTEDSPVAGFARAEFASWGAGSIGGAGMLSYRVGTGEWQFFRAAQQGPSCSAYDTPELRNAFAGRSCLLPDGTSDEVQPAA
ncbi:hypothetical protein, partial [Leucobacter sp. M11]|uniref:hypothetical protein n=1 Tax=Leucobacter sp. M11 TaxID=2993565 RepID=UPI002D806A58